ncbi:MAG: hypothetical protein V4700_03230 [Pseudomonadota bacterium]
MKFNKKINPYVVLGLLIFIFVAPLVLAAMLYRNAPDWLHNKMLNKGQFLSPPLDFTNLKKHLIRSADIHKPWLIFYLTKSECNQLCQQRLHLLHQIILALGKNRSQVNAALIQTRSSITFKKPINAYWITINEYRRFFKRKKMDNAYYIVAPGGKIILYYPADTLGEDLYKDLILLLI